MASDRLRTIETRLKLSKEGDAEVFREVAKDIDDLGNVADKSIGRLQDKINKGFGASEKDIARTKVAIDEYRKALEEAEKAGGEIGEAATAKLKTLDDQLANCTDSVGEFRKAQQDAKRDLDDATEAAGGNIESITSLDGAMKKLAEQTGTLSVLMKANLIASLLELAGELNGKVVDGLNSVSKALGGQGDEFKLVGGILPVYQKGIDGVTESLANMVTGIDDSKEALERQKKELEAYEAAQQKFLEKRKEIQDKEKEAAEQEKRQADEKKKREEEAERDREKRRAEEAKKEEERQRAEQKAEETRRKEDEQRRKQDAAEDERHWQEALKRSLEAAEAAEKASKAPDPSGWDVYISKLDEVSAANERVAESSQRAALSVSDVLDGKGTVRDLANQGRAPGGLPQLAPESGAQAGEP